MQTLEFDAIYEPASRGVGWGGGVLFRIEVLATGEVVKSGVQSAVNLGKTGL